MPHTNDRTLITAAGDSEVRIFDIEYSGAAAEASTASAIASQGRRGARRTLYNGVRYLSDGNTNCRVYRSHGDRVKRIVTESSPHLFITCSEDGEVRQWDLRQPSSAYPSPTGRYGADDQSSLPPALISYKSYNLDLNTISCSPSQPHYIALGGAHLHCFLHDRRMTGRDMILERGGTPLSAGAMSNGEEELMGQATRCVKKFAPHGQPRMKRTANGHITACKISDAHPNEMVVSWSGDHIYSFDLIRSPDASEQVQNERSSSATNSHKARESGERKRKRKTGSQISLTQEGTSRAESRQRTEGQRGEMALRVQYGNGQSEDIPIEAPQRSTSPISSLRESVLSDRQRRSHRLAKSVVNLRKTMFTLDPPKAISERDPTGHTSSLTTVLGYAASIYPEMLEISSAWRYPVDPSTEDIVLQRTLRSHRDSVCRFVQAAGVIARALGGRSQTAAGNPPSHFNTIAFAPTEGPDVPAHEVFDYDFLKAIFLWLDSGVGALLEGFTSTSPLARNASRLPVPNDSGIEAIDEVLIPYLLELASDRPVVNVDASRFELNEHRVIYATERDAVVAFAAAVKVPFADLSSMNDPSSKLVGATVDPSANLQSRRDALYHWGFTIARGVLMNAGEGVNFAFVDRAFGGIGTVDRQTSREEASVLSRQQDIDTEDEEPAVRAFQIVNNDPAIDDEAALEEEEVVMTSDPTANTENSDAQEEQDSESDDDDEDSEDENAVTTGPDGVDSDDEDADAGSGEDNEEEDEDEDEDAAYGMPFYRSAFERRRLRERVEASAPCSSHTRVYSGHCNIRTVKDVNFWGLDDEYVVSGSDDGNLFIWDHKTGQLVNILEGDGEVVNVLQGHPYEPLLAVSGIDHTIKIFSPDVRAREAARLGRGVAAADASDFSSIAWPTRIRGRRLPRQPVTTSEPAMPSREAQRRAQEEANEEDDEEFVAPNGLASRKKMHEEYQIVSRNDVDRQGGNTEAYVTVCWY